MTSKTTFHDMRKRSIDEWIGEVRPLTPEDLSQLGEARQDREGWDG
ncbi:hypothetical protein [Burkholderia mayonis]|nr:hypothetical protein [Burkholderia mayonis]